MKRKRTYSTGKKFANKRTKKISTPYGTPYYKKNSYNLYKSPREIMPQEYVTTLRFSSQQYLTAVGNTQKTVRFIDDAFDIDPTVGGTSMAGFSELATIYARYRPLRATLSCEFANLETFPLACMLLMSNSSAATPLAYADIGNPFSRKCMITGVLGGMSLAKLHVSAAKTAIAGTQQPLYDDLYTGSTSSASLATAATTNMFIGIESSNNLTLAGGSVLISFTISLTLQFYRQNSFTA